MKYDDERASAEGGAQRPCADASEALLRAEVGFWRELLDSCDQAMPPESIERMRQALALAERRFLQLCCGEGTDFASSGGPGGTSSKERNYLH